MYLILRWLINSDWLFFYFSSSRCQPLFFFFLFGPELSARACRCLFCFSGGRHFPHWIARTFFGGVVRSSLRSWFLRTLALLLSIDVWTSPVCFQCVVSVCLVCVCVGVWRNWFIWQGVPILRDGQEHHGQLATRPSRPSSTRPIFFWRPARSSSR